MTDSSKPSPSERILASRRKFLAAAGLAAPAVLAAPAIVRDIALFDMYQGKGLGENQKSLAFHIVMQDTARTLEDAEIEAAVAQLVAVAARDFAASLR